MNDPGFVAWLLVTFASGVALGGFFFGGLWLTTRSLTTSLSGMLIVALSFVVRTSFVLIGMYWLTEGDWRSLLACLAGFIVARTVILNRVFRSQDPHTTVQKEATHEHVA